MEGRRLACQHAGIDTACGRRDAFPPQFFRGNANFAGTDFHILPLEKCVPAASQALIAMQCRSRDRAIFARAASVAGTHSFLVERAFLSALGEGCHTSFAVHFSRERLLLFRQDLGFVERKIAFPRSVPAIRAKVAQILAELGVNGK